VTTLQINDAAPPQIDKSSRFPWDKVIAWTIGALLAYGAIQSRLAVLEVRYEQMARDVAEIKSDVKTLIQTGGGGGSR
jgi:hypothetical protein